MAKVWYPKFLQNRLIGAGPDLSAVTIECVFLDLSLYTYGAGHEFLSDVPALARVGTPQAIGSKTFTLGVFDGSNLAFPAIPAGNPLGAYLVYIATGVDGTSNLMVYSTQAGSDLPFTPTGAPEALTWNGSGIAAL